MKLRMLLAAGIGIVFAVVPSTASAKGPQSVEITGPGLDEPIRLDYDADAPVPLNALLETAGIYRAFETPTPWTEDAPPGRRGRGYAATYVVFGPEEEESPTVHQELYPFADGGPLVYTPPGQRFFGTEPANGGWMRADQSLRVLLVAVGVPEPDASRSQPAVESQIGWPAPTSIGVGIAALIAGFGLGVSLRAWPGRARPGLLDPPR